MELPPGVPQGQRKTVIKSANQHWTRNILRRYRNASRKKHALTLISAAQSVSAFWPRLEVNEYTPPAVVILSFPQSCLLLLTPIGNARGRHKTSATQPNAAKIAESYKEHSLLREFRATGLDSATHPVIPSKKTILIVYFSRGVFPLRSTIHSHLYCWKKYSRHHVVYINLALSFPERMIRLLKVDAIIFHTMFLSTRWMPEVFMKYAAKCSYLKTLTCTKIILPQDEFLHTELLNDFCLNFGITHILSNSKESDWNKIYGRLDRNAVAISTVLTGYLDPETVAKIKKLSATRNDLRHIDIGYRAWKAEYWLGEHATHKTRIAAVVKRAADQLGLRTDISLEEKDVIPGDAWFEYLLDCKATIGVEGGASVLDKDGRIKDCVAAFLQQNPKASFEETREHCFKYEDGKLDLACISPRHLEACATGTVQFLVEGSYNGILVAGRHYVPIKKDYSNLDDCLGAFTKPDYMHNIAVTAYDEIVASGKWSYPAFVTDIERSMVDTKTPTESQKHGLIQHGIRIALEINDALNWRLIQAARWCMDFGLKTKTGRWVYSRLSQIRGS